MDMINEDRPSSPSVYSEDRNITLSDMNNGNYGEGIISITPDTNINGFDMNVFKEFLINILGLDMKLMEHSLILGIIFLMIGIVIFLYIWKYNEVINKKIKDSGLEKRLSNSKSDLVNKAWKLIFRIDNKRRNIIKKFSKSMIIFNGIFILIAIWLLLLYGDIENIKLLFKW
uniref:hypothetical protein n=1 Tax=Conidiobolus polytocus TaxID=1167814 RepID=UPI001D100A1D|nr:hypothetical protein LK372_mgp06 [Conidiobolus polytocus]QZZ81384.1 hypothetical protein [Conidiobolus polytocus]